MSLTLPSCRQPSCCDEWTGYGITLLPRSSAGDNGYRTLPRAGDPACPANGVSRGASGGEGALQAADVRCYGGTSNNALTSWCGRFPGVPASTLAAACSCRLGAGSIGDQTAHVSGTI